MDFNLYPYKVFVEVARARSLTRAAADLGISQPAVSAHIKALEEKFGDRLLQRGVKGASLTALGQEVHAQALVLLAELEELQRLMDGSSPQSAPVIGASTTPGAFWLPRRLAELQKRHSFGCNYRIADSLQVRAWVLDRSVLFGLVGELPPNAGLQGLESAQIGADSLQLMATSRHPLLGRENLKPSDFREETLLLRSPGSSVRARTESMLSPLLGNFHRIVELSSGEAIKEAVVAGLGLAVLSTWSVQRELQEGLIEPLDSRRWSQLRPIYLIRRAGRPLKRQAAFLWDFLCADEATR